MRRRFLLIFLCLSPLTLWGLWRGYFEWAVKAADSSPPVNDGKAVAPVTLVFSQQYTVNLGGLERLHPFDILKYEKIVNQLVQDQVVERDQIWEPKELQQQDILRVQSQEFLDSLSDKSKLVGYLEADELHLVPQAALDRGLLRPFRYSAGGTLMAADLALTSGQVAINLGGGYHHAKPDRGEGFCIYADVPIAIRKLQADGRIERALIIDVDAHQGNGTIQCLADDDQTFCFSMHQGDIYPIPKEQGDLDVALKAGTGDLEFLKILREQLPVMFERSRPDLVFVIGGCDPLAGDPLAGLEMTVDGIVQRDQMIIDYALQQQVPIVLTLAGGYSQDAWRAQYQSVKNILQQHGALDER